MKKKRLFIALAAMSMAAVWICTGCSGTEKTGQTTTETQAAEKKKIEKITEKITEKETVKGEAQAETEKKTEGTAVSTSSTRSTRTSTGTSSKKDTAKQTMHVGLSESQINNTEFGRYTWRSGGNVGSWGYEKHFAYYYYWEDASGKQLLKVHTSSED